MLSDDVVRLHVPRLILYPSPGFIALWSRLIYQSILAQTTGLDSPNVLSRQAKSKVWTPDPASVQPSYSEVAAATYNEYLSVLSALNWKVGIENIRLIRTNALTGAVGEELSSLSSDDLKLLDESSTWYNSDILNQFDFRMITLLEEADRSCLYPRDLFSTFSSFVFMTPQYFPSTLETKRYLRSSLGEGGSMVRSGKMALIGERMVDQDVLRVNDTILERRGYKLAAIPHVMKESQPATKQKFVPHHIDGHCNLVQAQDDSLHLLIAASYMKQDERTTSIVNRAASYLQAEIHVVEDAELQPLAFNWFDLPNGDIVYSTPGWDGEKFRVSNILDEKLIEIVGEDRIVPISVLKYLSSETWAGVRCFTNLASEHFLSHISREEGK